MLQCQQQQATLFYQVSPYKASRDSSGHRNNLYSIFSLRIKKSLGQVVVVGGGRMLQVLNKQMKTKVSMNSRCGCATAGKQ